MVPAAPPTRKNQRATSCPAPISKNAPYFRGSRLICSALLWFSKNTFRWFFQILQIGNNSEIIGGLLWWISHQKPFLHRGLLPGVKSQRLMQQRVGDQGGPSRPWHRLSRPNPKAAVVADSRANGAARRSGARAESRQRLLAASGGTGEEKRSTPG